MGVRVLIGDALSALRTLPSESVQCVVSSPPYLGLRDYGLPPSTWPDGWIGCLGLEPTPALYIEHLLSVFDEVKRVLRRDGLAFVNLGDSYSGSGKGPSNSLQRPASCLNDRQLAAGVAPTRWVSVPEGIPAKNLLLIPERFCIGMQSRGWIVRKKIAWCKLSAMPESVTDRPTSAWEPIFMFAKHRTYYYDGEAVRQAHTGLPPSHYGTLKAAPRKVDPNGVARIAVDTHARPREYHPAGANLRDYWLLGPSPFAEAHFATFPPEIPRRCILAGTSERGACPQCGAPWRRVVERGESDYARLKGDGSWRDLADAQAHRGVMGDGGRLLGKHALNESGSVPSLHAAKAATLGWSPGCLHDAGPPIPQTVLDPFLGSGTTALVADRLGRDAIGIELSADYAAMAERRIREDAGTLFGESVAVEEARQVAMFEDEGESYPVSPLAPPPSPLGA